MTDTARNVSSEADLRAEIGRLHTIIDALMAQAERQADAPQSAYGMFQATVWLEDLVRSRTHELEAALARNEKIGHDLQIAHEKLEQSERLSRNIIEFAPIGMCIADISMRYLMVNKAFCAMLGYSRDELLRLTPLDVTHPEDIERSRDLIEQLMGGQVDSYQIEKRYVCKSGKVIWLAVTTSSLTDGNGNPTHLIGQFEDITERRRAEEQMRLAAAVYQYSSQAMMICDASNRIIATNPAFTELTGYRMQDVLGQNPRVLASGRQGKEFYDAMWHSLVEHGHWEGELWNRRKSGEIYAEWLSISIVRDDQGAIQHYVALSTDITEKKKEAELIWEHANYDILTTLPNRRLFRDRLDQDIRKACRSGKAMALLFIDLDHFKEVNDTLGHQYGDELLVQVADRLKAEVRNTDTIARMGGDEFTALLNDLASEHDAGMIAQELIVSLAEPFDVLGHEVHVSGSIGIALYPADGINAEDLIRNADDAMYQSKNKGRNQYTYFNVPQPITIPHK